jgi:hypothetical protein
MREAGRPAAGGEARSLMGRTPTAAAADQLRSLASSRAAWTLSGVSVSLAVASVGLAAVNGTSLLRLVAEHLGGSILSAIGFPVLGALIVARQPRNAFAWVLLAQGVFHGVFVFAWQYAPLALGLSAAGAYWWLPGGTWASWLASWSVMPAIALDTSLLVLLFPDGRLPSPRWRPAAWAALTVAVVPTVVLAVINWPLRGPELARAGFVGATRPALVVFVAAFALALGLLVVCVVALARRFGRSVGVQRQQLKWFAYAGLVSVPLNLVAQLGGAGAIMEPLQAPALTGQLGGAGAIMELLQVPVLTGAIAIAMFRYRLYDIDRLINRTLVYGLLSVALAATYAAGVLGIGQTLTADRQPPGLVVAATTLAVAAIFHPARRRIQQGVDRRFNRRGYDAAKTIEAFSARRRQQTDLDALTSELLTVVTQTMQPTHAALWLRPASTTTTAPHTPSGSPTDPAAQPTRGRAARPDRR